MIAEINDFFSDYNFDVREANGARFMDQKVLPDVLSAVSECIIEFIKDNINREFTVRDIWDSPYAQTLITESFNKPNLKNADSEYNKFFGQPIKTLSFSKVLNEPITFEYQSLDDFGKNNLSNDIPNWVKNLILEMYKDYEDGIFYLFEL